MRAASGEGQTGAGGNCRLDEPKAGRGTRPLRILKVPLAAKQEQRGPTGRPFVSRGGGHDVFYGTFSQIQFALTADWRESGFKDPLSGLSTWSFWPTLNSLSKMLLDAGFIPKILETDTTAPGQSPHGTTILARHAASVSVAEKDDLLRELQKVLASLPADHGSKLRGPFATRVAQSIAEVRRAYRRLTKAA